MNKESEELVKIAKSLVSEDDNPWGHWGGTIITQTEENIRRIKKTLSQKGWPEGYVGNLKNSLKRLESDLKEYKSQAKNAGAKIAKTNVVLMNDLWNDEKYFTRRGLDSTDRNVFGLVNKMNDVITMGKIIGVPVKFWKPQDKADFRKHGLDSKFRIAGRIAKQDGPFLKVINKYWNDIHDLEDALDTVMLQYDKASSYRGVDDKGTKEAAAVLKSVKAIKAKLEKLTMSEFGNVVNAEKKYIKNNGTPEEHTTRMRNKMFKN